MVSNFRLYKDYTQGDYNGESSYHGYGVSDELCLGSSKHLSIYYCISMHCTKPFTSIFLFNPYYNTTRKL